MDCIDTGLAGDAQYAVDIEIGLDRALALADKISFVGLEAIER